ncbi:ribonuclease P protein component 3 [archaeon]|nr:ribonuclease P protein component 3 [archaeon]
MFIDLRVHSINSKGVDSPSRLKKEARDLGIEVALCDGIKYDDFISGIELTARNKRELIREIVSSKKFDIIVVHGGRAEINRSAVSDTRVDILAHPWLGRRDSGVDAVVAREAADNGVAIELCISYLLIQHQRLKIFSSLRRIKKLKDKYNFEILVTSGAKCKYDLRNKYEIASILYLLGLEEEDIKESINLPEKLIRKKGIK